jgi:hypothetical protein
MGIPAIQHQAMWATQRNLPTDANNWDCCTLSVGACTVNGISKVACNKKIANLLAVLKCWMRATTKKRGHGNTGKHAQPAPAQQRKLLLSVKHSCSWCGHQLEGLRTQITALGTSAADTHQRRCP